MSFIVARYFNNIPDYVLRARFAGGIPNHQHPESDIVNLVDDLANKAGVSHDHAFVDEDIQMVDEQW